MLMLHILEQHQKETRMPTGTEPICLEVCDSDKMIQVSNVVRD